MRGREKGEERDMGNEEEKREVVLVVGFKSQMEAEQALTGLDHGGGSCALSLQMGKGTFFVSDAIDKLLIYVISPSQAFLSSLMLRYIRHSLPFPL